jgi:hypothetical protein
MALHCLDTVLLDQYSLCYVPHNSIPKDGIDINSYFSPDPAKMAAVLVGAFVLMQSTLALFFREAGIRECLSCHSLPLSSGRQTGSRPISFRTVDQPQSFSFRIVADIARRVKINGCAVFGRVCGPMRQAIVIRIPGSGKSHPGSTDLLR